MRLIHARNLRGDEEGGWLAQGLPDEVSQLGPNFR
jgi:hypothetical protein